METIIGDIADIITAMALILYIGIGCYVIQYHRVHNNKNYKRSGTVTLFHWFFAMIAASHIIFIFLHDVQSWLVVVFKVMKALISIAVFLKYYIDLPNFIEIQIPEENVEEEVEKRIFRKFDKALKDGSITCETHECLRRSNYAG
jgi:hypothetical protein